MKKTSTPFLLLLILLFSCNQKDNSYPSWILTDSTSYGSIVAPKLIIGNKLNNTLNPGAIRYPKDFNLSGSSKKHSHKANENDWSIKSISRGFCIMDTVPCPEHEVFYIDFLPNGQSKSGTMKESYCEKKVAYIDYCDTTIVVLDSERTIKVLLREIQRNH